jgi:hypothetical protein
MHRGFREKGWKLIRGSKGSDGAARNAAAAAADGDHLLFMDADDYAKPDKISTFVTAAMHCGADILSCFIDRFAGDDTPPNGECAGRAIFLGAAIAPGLFYNRFGSGNFLVRKAAFERLGGFAQESTREFSADYSVGGDGWEFLARAALEGLRLETVPRALAWHRVRDETALKTAAGEHASRMRAMRPYLEALPPTLKDVLPYAQSMQQRLERAMLEPLPNQRFGAQPEIQPESQDGQIQNHPAIGADGLDNHASGNGHKSLDDEELRRLIRHAAADGHRPLVSALNAWMDYRSIRSGMPERRLQRVPGIIHLLVRGRYHRFAHGFGSALRDLRRPPKV